MKGYVYTLILFGLLIGSMLIVVIFANEEVNGEPEPIVIEKGLFGDNKIIELGNINSSNLEEDHQWIYNMFGEGE